MRRRILTLLAVLGLSLGLSAPALAAPAGHHHHSAVSATTPLFPDCTNVYLVKNQPNTTRQWFEGSAGSPPYFLYDVGYNGDTFCAVNEAHGWQEIVDQRTDDCLTQDGDFYQYFKPCDSSKTSELWASVNNSSGNALIYNDYWDIHNVNCVVTNLVAVISFKSGSTGTEMLCPQGFDGTNYYYLDYQAWVVAIA